MSALNVLVNNSFQSKKMSLTDIADTSENFTLKPTFQNKEYLYFELDDPQTLNVIPGGYYTFGHYQFNRDNPDPQDSANGSWQTYGNLTPSCNVGLNPETYTGLKDSLLISDGSKGTVYYYYKALTQEQQDQIKSTGIGICEFKIGINPLAFTRVAPYKFSAISQTYPTIFKDHYNDQQSFVSFGAYDVNRPELQFRFVLVFRTKYIPASDSWEIYVFRSINDPITAGVKINGWNGQTLRDFKCEYAPGGDNAIKGTLSIKDNISGLWTTVLDNIIPAQDVATYSNAPEFGSYSTPGVASLAIAYYDFKAFIRSEYKFELNGQLFNNSIDFINYCNNYYKFNIVANDSNAEVNWFFNNKQNNNNLINGYITFNNDWFSVDKLNDYNYFEKRIKPISVWANPGAITEVNLNGKNISKINTKGLVNLTTVICPNNKLRSIDLSANKKLGMLVLSNNQFLEKIILPDTDFNLDVIKVANCPKLRELHLINNKSTQKTITEIDISNLQNLEYLTLRNVKISNPETFVQIILSDTIKSIDISESNILTNKTNLETFLNNLPDKTGKETGVIYLYGKKYVDNGIQGSAKAIAQTLENVKNKNWIFYL